MVQGKGRRNVLVSRTGEVSGTSQFDSLVTRCPTLICDCCVFGDSDDWNLNCVLSLNFSLWVS